MNIICNHCSIKDQLLYKLKLGSRQISKTIENLKAKDSKNFASK